MEYTIFHKYIKKKKRKKTLKQILKYILKSTVTTIIICNHDVLTY